MKKNKTLWFNLDNIVMVDVKSTFVIPSSDVSKLYLHSDNHSCSLDCRNIVDMVDGSTYILSFKYNW